MNRTIHIDRLDLDLRGIDPGVADAAVRLLGPALQAALARGADRATPAAHIDAGRIAPVSEPQALAERLSQRIAGSLAGGRRQG